MEEVCSLVSKLERKSSKRKSQREREKKKMLEEKVSDQTVITESDKFKRYLLPT